MGAYPAACPPAQLALALLLVGLFAGAAAEAGREDSPAAAAAAAQSAQVISPNDLTSEEAAWLRDADTALLSDYLAQTLAGADAGYGPLLFVGDAADDAPADAAPAAPAAAGDVWKRSRYYRRYPWKRQPGRGGGAPDFDNPYLCNPTREDVFQLLVALHEARAGNLGRTVKFCNRHRPAASVFTNIRFLGRRR